ncbi:uncharacterized protein LOC123407078 [Hordeum vulgare subsp. vulgare]|uniref:uncharacterized protein LOC123407078 n=1 Tax=Hordeum vulgare subsp. vulgare TaxID=112509 RepID=UPI001D1A3598|nr:uncharacterized protein LOC123407078 [Hordeum vulgare subsp. vulgare]
MVFARIYRLEERAARMKCNDTNNANPECNNIVLWDFYGESDAVRRATMVPLTPPPPFPALPRRHMRILPGFIPRTPGKVAARPRPLRSWRKVSDLGRRPPLARQRRPPGWCRLRAILVGRLDHAGGKPPAGAGCSVESPLLVGYEVHPSGTTLANRCMPVR